MRKGRKIPQRKCIATNEMKPKHDMIRIVRNKEGEVFIDPTGKQNGRGAYLTLDEDVIKKAEKDQLIERTFQVKIESSIYEDLLQLVKEQHNEE